MNIYIHIPFCTQKCRYCAFYSIAGKKAWINPYMQAVIDEIEGHHEWLENEVIESIYFGGGTPSLLSAIAVDAVMKKLETTTHILPGAEVTIEANPETISEEKCKGYLAAGVNRISIGLQAWQNRLLSTMNRAHTQQEFLTAYHTAVQAGFTNIGVDLIFGLPGQTYQDWQETLDKVIALKPTHLSCYSLELHNRSTWGKLQTLGRLSPATEAIDRQMYHYARTLLPKHGYIHYEISNWARNGFECRHNVDFWHAKPYFGFGAGAHSFFRRTYSYNREDIHEYINHPLKIARKVKSPLHAKNWLMLRFRLIKGFTLADYTNITKSNFTLDYQIPVQELLSLKLIAIDHDNVALTPKGLDVYDGVMKRLFS